MIKKDDFIELDYTGRIKDDKIVFDTTVEQAAKDNNIHNPNYKYKSVIVCIGEKHLIKGLEDQLIGKNPGKYTIEVKAENAFGKKSADLLKLIPAKLFTKDDIKPFVGLEVNVDNQLGIVRSASGGRVIVDFNHPLASRDLVYEVDVKRIVTDAVEKVRAVLELMSVPFEDVKVSDNTAVVKTKTKLPEEATKGLAEHIQKLTGLKSVKFITEEKEEKAKEKKKEEITEKKEKAGPAPEDQNLKIKKNNTKANNNEGTSKS